MCLFLTRLQLWLASSLLADALAVAAQSLMARDVGSGSLRGARQVAARVSSLCLGLGLILAAAMAAGGAVLPQLFSSDPAVLHLVRGGCWVRGLGYHKLDAASGNGEGGLGQGAAPREGWVLGAAREVGTGFGI